MKSKIITLSLIVLCAKLGAQSEPLSNDIQKYTKRVDSIVSVEKQKMNSEMDVWKLKLEQQKISEKKYNRIKKEIAEKYSKTINTKIDLERKSLDSITTKTVQESVFRKPTKNNTRDPKTKITIGNTKDKPSRYGSLIFSYAIMNLTGKSDFDVFNKKSDMRIGNSHSFEVFYRRTNQLGKKSPFFIHYGVAYRSDTYMPKSNRVFSEENDQLVLKKFENGNLKRSKLRNTYITAPVEFSWKASKRWQFGLGGYAGINTRNIIKVKYRNDQDRFKKIKNVVETGVNPYIVGGKLSVSYRSFRFFIKKDFTPAFDNKASLNYKNNVQLGLVIGSIGL